MFELSLPNICWNYFAFEFRRVNKLQVHEGGLDWTTGLDYKFQCTKFLILSSLYSGLWS